MPITPSRQLAGFLSKYTPEVRTVARGALAKLRKRLPGGIELVYDNYNALVIGFGPTERPSDAILSLAVYPRYASLCFLFGAELTDPSHRLQGAGTRVRHIRLEDASTLDDPAVKALITQALECAPEPMTRKTPRALVIRSISAKQRPRRPR